ncbi:MAG: hypothetical protein SFV52_15885 [Saprospiraceae bacterium]|nr:hypothetical protein [Saprospiraceae bacterium]
MKTFNFYLYWVIALALITVSACKKDDDDPANYISIFDKNYTLSKGYISDYIENANSTYNYRVFLMTDSLDYNLVSGGLIGKGTVIFMEINTSSPGGITSGTYNYSDTGNAFTFKAEIGLETAFTGGGGGMLVIIAGGSIDIVVDGQETEFILDLTTNNNKKVTGRFKGNLTEI